MNSAPASSRSSETEAELQLRLLNAIDEMQHWALYAYTIVSRSKEEDLAKFLSILTAERLRSNRLRFPA